MADLSILAAGPGQGPFPGAAADLNRPFVMLVGKKTSCWPDGTTPSALERSETVLSDNMGDVGRWLEECAFIQRPARKMGTRRTPETFAVPLDNPDLFAVGQGF